MSEQLNKSIKDLVGDIDAEIEDLRTKIAGLQNVKAHLAKVNLWSGEKKRKPGPVPGMGGGPYPPTDEPLECIGCGEVKDADEFAPDKRLKAGRIRTCSTCKRKKRVGPKPAKNPPNLYQRGRSWMLDFRFQGKRHVEKLGPISRALAVKRAEATKLEAAEGKLVIDGCVWTGKEWSPANAPEEPSASQEEATVGKRVKRCEGECGQTKGFRAFRSGSNTCRTCEGQPTDPNMESIIKSNATVYRIKCDLCDWRSETFGKEDLARASLTDHKRNTSHAPQPEPESMPSNGRDIQQSLSPHWCTECRESRKLIRMFGEDLWACAGCGADVAPEFGKPGKVRIATDEEAELLNL